jgi:hypothetical protein
LQRFSEGFVLLVRRKAQNDASDSDFDNQENVEKDFWVRNNGP